MKIRNISRTDLYVPAVGRPVAADEVIDVPDAQGPAFLCQPRTWAAESTPTKSKSE